MGKALWRRLMIIALGLTFILGLMGSAVAHPRWIKEIEVVQEDAGIFDVNVTLNRSHAGTMRISIFRKVEGEWKKTTTEPGMSEDSKVWWGSFAREDTKCRVKVRFTSPNHAVAVKWSDTVPASIC